MENHPESVAYRHGVRDGRTSDTGPRSPYFADSREHEAYLEGYEDGREEVCGDVEYVESWTSTTDLDV